jgi:hypothetical protein
VVDYGHILIERTIFKKIYEVLIQAWTYVPQDDPMDPFIV